MLRNLFKITVRNFLKRKTYTIINVFGLAVGLSVCLVISRYIEQETSYDSFHTNARNIYRVVSSLYTDGPKDAFTGYDLGPALLANFPEIKSIARLHDNGTIVSFIGSDNKKVRHMESGFRIVDSTFLRIFSFRFIKGNASSALSNPNSIVITQSAAKRYFGNADPVGKVIQVEGFWVPGFYTVTAVLEDLPRNSHLDFRFLVPMHNLLASNFYRNNNSRWDNFATYVELKENADVSLLRSKIQAFAAQYRGVDKSINVSAELQLQPLLDIHYSPDLNNPGTQQKAIYLFGVVAIVVLVIAWVNYINLSTARAMERAREVGVKKAIGVTRWQLVQQFLFESLLINIIGVLLAIGAAWLLMYILNGIIGQSLVIGLDDPKTWTIVAILIVAGTLASGIYPAFVLSSFKTTEVIKGKVASGSEGLSLRNGLVVFQFACSLLLLVGTFVIHRQVLHMQNQEKRFNTKVLVLKGPELAEEKGLSDRMINFKNELLHLSTVAKVATSFSIPAHDASLSAGMRRFGRPVEENRIGNVYWLDADFMDLYRIPLLTGRTWDPKVQSEMESAIVNEEAVKVFQLGSNEQAIGQKLITPGGVFPILGVVKNHHWQSMKKPFEAMVFRVERIAVANVSIQLTGNPHDAIGQIERTFKAAFPNETFSYYFLDDYYNSQYQTEEQFGKLFSLFAMLAVLVGCLGLCGLASYATIRRSKEISIRKVLGASVHAILYLLTSQFLRPLVISTVVALPVVWLGATQWLSQFPYRIRFTADLFLIPSIVLAVVALLTIAIQTVRAANSNPTQALKNE